MSKDQNKLFQLRVSMVDEKRANEIIEIETVIATKVNEELVMQSCSEEMELLLDFADSAKKKAGLDYEDTLSFLIKSVKYN